MLRAVIPPSSSKRRHLLGLASLPLVLALGACTPEVQPVTPGQPGPTTTAVVSAAPTAKPAAPKVDVYAPQGPFGEEVFVAVAEAPLAKGALTLEKAPAGVTKAPAVCAEYAKNKATEVPACGDRQTALAALDKALALATPGADGSAPAEAAVKARDAALAALEGCAGVPAGVIRALRADLLPAACGDVLAEPILKAPPKELRADVHEALFGMALAARLSRAGGAFPVLAAPFTKERVEKHVKGPIATWMKDVATALQAMSDSASKLHNYGGAIAAVAAGVADLALVEAVRGAPIPDDMAKDEERRNIYYASLDEQLEPRKRRGRDAALVGLLKFAEVGAIHDARVREARRLLSKLYGGRRIDALDRLMVPAAPAPGAASVEERLAARLPTFYSGLLLDSKGVTQAGVLAGLANQGLPLAHRQALRATPPSGDLAPHVARAHLSLGQLYWRAVDFEEAAKAMSLVPAASRSPETKLLAALAIGLRGGPKDAAEMMVKLPLGMNLPGQRAALDALSAEGTPMSGPASFDSGYLMEIAAPERADGVYFRSIAKRYRAAVDLLTDPKQKAEASERAASAEAIAGEIKQ